MGQPGMRKLERGHSFCPNTLAASHLASQTRLFCAAAARNPGAPHLNLPHRSDRSSCAATAPDQGTDAPLTLPEDYSYPPSPNQLQQDAPYSQLSPTQPFINHSWSTSPAAGTDTWVPADTLQQTGRVWPHNASTAARGDSMGFDSATDWQLLGEAAADIARFKTQRQAKAASSGASSSSSSSNSSGGAGSSSLLRLQRKWMRQLRDVPGWLLYRYYNWRQDTASDLLLVTGLSMVLLCTAAIIKHTWIDTLPAPQEALPPLSDTLGAAASDTAATAGASAAAAATAAGAAATAAGGSSGVVGQASSVGAVGAEGLRAYALSLWTDVYQVLVLSFGENFPNADVTDPIEEVFSLFVALVGLAGFALALALVEQIVLETNLANVSTGSRVYESGHYLVLGWGIAQGDLELMIKLVGQLCCASRSEGGTNIVVLTQREKLEMEELFRRTIPMSARYGTRLVFRQGSPLLPSDLSNVAASNARATIILSDQSRSRDEADAQSLRCAILLDELDDYRGLRKGRALGHIVVETRTANAIPLLRYSCSKRAIALPTGQLNARRVAGMVKRPFVSWVTQRIWDFSSRCSVFFQPCRDHVGMRFCQVPFQYPDAVVLGVANVISGHVMLNPPLDYRILPDDQLVLCRPTAVPQAEYGHLPHLLTIPELEALGQQQLAQQQQAAAAAQERFGRIVYPLRLMLWQRLAAQAGEVGRGNTLPPAAAAAAAAAAVVATDQDPQQQKRDWISLLLGAGSSNGSGAAAPNSSSSSSSSKKGVVEGGIVADSDEAREGGDPGPGWADYSSGSSDWYNSSSSRSRSGKAAFGSSSSSGSSSTFLPVSNSSSSSSGISEGCSSAAPVNAASSSSTSSGGLAVLAGYHVEGYPAGRDRVTAAAPARTSQPAAAAAAMQVSATSNEAISPVSLSTTAAAGALAAATAVLPGAAAAGIGAGVAAAAAAAASADDLSRSSSSQLDSSRSLQRSSSRRLISPSKRGMACSSAIMSDEEGAGSIGLFSSSSSGSSSSIIVTANEELDDVDDDVIEDELAHQDKEGDIAADIAEQRAAPPLPAAAACGGSSSSSISSGERGSGRVQLSAEVQGVPGASQGILFDAGDQLDAGGGSYQLSGWSSLESTLDSIDALPGFGRTKHDTTNGSSLSSYSSSDRWEQLPQAGLRPISSPSSSSSSTSTSSGSADALNSSGSGSVGTAKGAGVSLASTPAVQITGAAAERDVPDTGPYSQYYGQQQRLQQQQQQQQRLQQQQQVLGEQGGQAITAGIPGSVQATTGESPTAAAAAAGSRATASPAAAAAAAAAAVGVDGGGESSPGGSPVNRYPAHSSFNYVPREYLCADSSPEAVLIAGWSGPGFMGQLLWELDQGTSALPPGSEIVFVNHHMPDDTLGRILKSRRLLNVKVSHVMLDPLRRDQLSVLPLHRFRAAIVLADEGWYSSSEGGGEERQQHDQQGAMDAFDVIDQPSVLRQDALMVMVQLNIRKLLEESGLPPINIICQKVANQGLTRFEDRRRLPLGISVNFNSMAAKLLTQVAVNPMTLTVMTQLGSSVGLSIVDASDYCARDEAISFWGVLRRAQAAGHVLLGYYILPSHIDQPIESTINPMGLPVRSKKRVWNTGDGRLKFIIIRDKSLAMG